MSLLSQPGKSDASFKYVMTEPSELIILNISCQIPGKSDDVFF